MKIFFKTLSTFLILFVIFGCQNQIVKMIKYEHLISSEFYSSKNIQSPNLKQFIEQDILLTIEVKGIANSYSGSGRTDFLFWLGADSERENRTIKIKKAILSGDEYYKNSEFKPQQLFLMEVATKTLQEKMLYSDSLLLFSVPSEKLAREKSNRSLTLEVFYEDPETKEEKSKKFEIERYEYHDIAWPT